MKGLTLFMLWCRRIFIIQHASVVVLRRGKARTCKIPPIITILYPVYLNGEIDLAKLGLSKMGTARLFSKCDRYWVLCPYLATKTVTWQQKPLLGNKNRCLATKTVAWQQKPLLGECEDARRQKTVVKVNQKNKLAATR